MAAIVVKMFSKRGVSPVIAWIAVMVAAITMAITATVFFKDITEDLSLDILKFGAESLECEDLSLYITTKSNCSTINITNSGIRTVEKVKVQYVDPPLATAEISGPIEPKSSVSFQGQQALKVSLLPLIEFNGEDLACSEKVINIDNCLYIPVCGDNIAEQGEPCDGTDLQGKTCSYFGFLGGTLSCINCQFDTSQCTNELGYIWDTITEFSLGTFLQTVATSDDVILDNNTGILGDGSDSNLTVSTSNVIINDHAYLTSNASSGSASIEVNDASSFSSGDEILMLQTQHPSDAGTYEFKTINLILGNSLTLSENLVNSYSTGIFNNEISYSTQIVKVPQYTDVDVESSGSITSKAWDGYSGGIVVFRASGDTNIQGSIDVSGKGFRGRDGINNNDGGQGEGYPGIGLGPTTSCFGEPGRNGEQRRLANGNGGGGGGCNSGTDNAIGGGGGAGHANNGSSGTSGWYGYGGNFVGSPNLSKIFVGGGGGSGGSPGDSSNPGSGGDGGGIIIIYTNELTVTGSLSSNGNIGTSAGGSCDYGLGGGGGASGGTINLIANSISVGSNLVTASAGSGGSGCSNAWSGGSGGSGSIGRIKLESDNISGTTNPSYTSVQFPSSGYYTSGTFTSEVFDSNSSSTAWDLFSWEYELNNNSLNISARSCDDISCSGELWNNLPSSPYNLSSFSPNMYFQYKADFSTSDTSTTPKLNKAIINYTL